MCQIMRYIYKYSTILVILLYIFIYHKIYVIILYENNFFIYFYILFISFIYIYI